MKRYGSVWLAALLVVAGLFWLLNRLAPTLDLSALAWSWWPLVMVAVGLGGAAHLRAPLGTAKGPLLFALLGLAVLAVIHNPTPASWRPALPPLVVCALGMAILIGRAVRASAPTPRPLERVLLVGLGRRIDWPVRAPSILDVRALASGSIITIPAGSTARAGRIEITALLSDVEVVVPAGWAVFVDDSRGNERLLGVPAAADAASADLQIQSLSLFGKVLVRTA
ncbi:hypothetical protein [Paractinoplanes toevensis]|uniref:Cell wall-active antibiotics response LiaF-like C-terminal domain-containing protein n=1 Tax=Paractinoplanes toevensis TaxID=571911 RepID=A0A919WB16_9ACTN|nr:hypothetical protein [Actinoplanes toevensis]GIM96850.1 hypothetical protein Ato02nite_086430 [Actinoplanes toevensis]